MIIPIDFFHYHAHVESSTATELPSTTAPINTQPNIGLPRISLPSIGMPVYGYPSFGLPVINPNAGNNPSLGYTQPGTYSTSLTTVGSFNNTTTIF